MAFTQDFRTQRRNYNDGETRIGEKDRLWYDSNTNTIRISDGVTLGGVIIGGGSGGSDYTLPTASATVRGGVKIGSNITITDGVISVAAPFSGSYTDLTNKPTIPSLTGYATESFVTSRGYLTSSALTGYATLTGEETLTNKTLTSPTINNPTFNGTFAFESNNTNQPAMTLTASVLQDGVGILRVIGSEPDINFNQVSEVAGFNTFTFEWNGDAKLAMGRRNDHSFYITRNFEGWQDNTFVLDYTTGVLSVPAGVSTGQINFTDETTQTTAWTGSVDWDDVNNQPTIPAAQIQSDWTQATTSALDYIKNKPTLFSGSYTDLTNKPTIPSLTGYATETYVTTRGYITSTNSLVNGNLSVVLNTDGSMTFPSNRVDGGANTIALWSSNQSSIVWRGTGGAGLPLQSVVQSREGLVNIGTTSGILGGAQTNYSWQFNTSGQMTFPDSTVQTTAWTGSVAYASVTGTPTLATVATSGSYSDLTNKPTNVSSFTNDSNYLTSVSWSQVTGKPQNIVTLNDTNVITNGMLVNNSITIGSTAVALGSSITTLTGLTGVTSNAATAFIAGTAAESGVALQMPREGALRNLTNGANNNMYFDVSIGGTSQGQFQFRSSSAFTNVLTMSPTAFNVNPDAVVTSRTPSFGRLPFNSAIDTELTIDDMRFRVSNQGGNFPQVIGNGSSRNLAWTVVAARSGSAVTQAGSTGTIVASNAWTSLYTLGGMDSAGDTYVATIQDKGASRIYRITFMRSDNGSTTGYNIIAERLL